MFVKRLARRAVSPKRSGLSVGLASFITRFLFVAFVEHARYFQRKNLLKIGQSDLVLRAQEKRFELSWVLTKWKTLELIFLARIEMIAPLLGFGYHQEIQPPSVRTKTNSFPSKRH